MIEKLICDFVKQNSFIHIVNYLNEKGYSAVNKQIFGLNIIAKK